MVVFSPNAPLISDVVLIVEIILAILLTIGVYLARVHKGTRHHWLMLVSFLVHLVFSVALMGFSFSLLLSLIDVTPLIPHVVVASIIVILAAVNVILGFIWRSKATTVMVLPPAKRKIHRLIGLVLLVLWYIIVVSGILVYSILYM